MTPEITKKKRGKFRNPNSLIEPTAGIFLLNPHLDSQIVVGELKRSCAATDSPSADASDPKKRKDGGDDVAKRILGFLRSAAIGKYDVAEEDREWKGRLLAMRKMMFMDLDNGDPSLKKKKNKISEQNGGLDYRSIMNLPIRRSSRNVFKLGDGKTTRKRIPIDPVFQADVPDWRGPPTTEEDPFANILYDRKRVGTKIWPMEYHYREIDDGVVGKGRPNSCFCTIPGSANCVRFHVNMSRIKLMCVLGPSFASLGFSSMGEEVSKLWTQEEQTKFDNLVKENPISEGKSFMEPALAYFKTKSRKDIVSFYYNVYLLQLMTWRTREGSESVESDDTYLLAENGCSD